MTPKISGILKYQPYSINIVRLCSNFWYGGFPKFGVTFLGVPIIMILVYWGLYWGPPVLGNYLKL